MKGYHLSNRKFGMLMSLPGLAILLLWVAVPLILLIWVSFMKYNVVQPSEFIGLRNYLELAQDRVFRLAVGNTMVFFAGSTLFAFLLSYPAAWALSRIRKGGTVLRTLIMFPWAVPLIVSGFIWGWIFNASYGVLNHVIVSLGLVESNVNFLGQQGLAMLAVVVADGWTRVPFMTILTLAGMESISKTLYESANIDGADFFQKTRYITMPLAKGPILTGLLITSVFSFRTIDAIFSLTKGGPARGTYVLGMLDLDYIYNYIQFGKAGAVSVYLLLMCLAIAGIYIYFLLKE
jgi:multiple sugar transport system permease protein